MLKFPKGYKQYKVLELIESNQNARQVGTTYNEIIKFAFELGSNRKYDRTYNRGYWSGIFKSPNPNSPWRRFDKTEGWATVLLNKDDKYYYLNSTGAMALENLRKKFGNMSPAEAIKLQESKKIKKKYPNTFSNIEKAKKEISNSLNTDNPADKTPKEILNNANDKFVKIDTGIQSTPVKLRGLNLDDKVAYYRKFNGKSGVATVISTMLYSSKSGNNDRIQLSIEGGTIPDIEYDKVSNSFKEASGFGIEIIKI
ncbi:hypothetical protein KY334_01545 [Candidatus Woesearchaeota archaeon]|nr:hypothetical protein [Candidatus Woesearchaeota archaeon]